MLEQIRDPSHMKNSNGYQARRSRALPPFYAKTKHVCAPCRANRKHSTYYSCPVLCKCAAFRWP